MLVNAAEQASQIVSGLTYVLAGITLYTLEMHHRPEVSTKECTQVDPLVETVTRFRAIRDEEKKQPQWRIYGTACIAFLCGTVLHSIFNIESDSVASSAIIVGIILQFSGVLLATTVDRDWNQYFNEHPWVSFGFFAIVFITGCCNAVLLDPAFALMSVPPAYALAFRAAKPFAMVVSGMNLFLLANVHLTLQCASFANGRTSNLTAQQHAYCKKEFQDVESMAYFAPLIALTHSMFALLGQINQLDSAIRKEWSGAFLLSVYAILLSTGTEICIFALLYNDSGLAFLSAYIWVMTGVVVLFRSHIYGCLSKWFERAQKAKDGAFIAALLDDAHAGVRPGQAQWVLRREFGRGPDLSVPVFHPRRHWVEGVVRTVNGGMHQKHHRQQQERVPGGGGGGDDGGGGGGSVQIQMAQAQVEVEVEVPEMGIRTIALSAHFGATAEVTLQEATRALRCVDWRRITPGLFESSAGSAATFALSRPVRAGERIDAFVSHSWSDDAAAKFAKLSTWAAAFEAAHGRAPTLWIDKVCLDQRRISDALRMLPANVMAADRLLVVHGPTYASRLWCVIELFCVFAFAPDYATAASHVELAGTADSFEMVARDLMRFRLGEAHCFDPNEEAKLRRMIAAVQTEASGFEENIRELGQQLLRAPKTSADAVSKDKVLAQAEPQPSTQAP